MELRLAGSKAGHDKGEIFYIVCEAGGYIYLADGKGRTLDKPKKKNLRHIQIIKNVPTGIKETFESKNVLMDSDVRSMLKLYKANVGKEEN